MNVVVADRGPGPARQWWRPCPSYSGSLCGGPDVCWTCGWGKVWHNQAFIDGATQRSNMDVAAVYDKGGARRHETCCFFVFHPAPDDRSTCRRCGHPRGVHDCPIDGHTHASDDCPDRDKRRIAAALAE